ncbi:MAG: hypothetical protein A2583_16630 [Bdellovibrionales bacterium RIFOXYD1_FULL_53_11]|nr:MAG: hypothetical protein A2583_16630 [Bdellovibrionales bacterium RIFOXYD1_FULL_53_11]
MKSAAIYARVSTKDQRPDMQISALRKYAKKRGFRVFDEYLDTESGASETRSGFNKMMNDARKRLVDVVLVWKFDRFARSTRMLLSSLDEFHSLGVDFISYTENVDTTTPMGRAMFTMIGAMAEFERDIIRSRVIAGLERAKERGVRLGRPALPQDAILEIRKLRKKGHSIRKIAGQVKLSIGVVAKYS